MRRIEYEERQNKINETYNADNETSKVLLAHECDNLQKGIADWDVYIIVLQMKLLAEKEECEGLKCKLKNEECKNENISRELSRVSNNFIQERNESLKLSECIRSQVGEIHKLELFKAQVREAKYENILMRDERDEIGEELKELKKWAEALKARFDAEVEEEDRVMEKNENFPNLEGRVRWVRIQQYFDTACKKTIKPQEDLKSEKKSWDTIQQCNTSLGICAHERIKTCACKFIVLRFFSL